MFSGTYTALVTPFNKDTRVDYGRLKALIDFETLYWAQVAEREKALARFEAMTGIVETGGVAQ